MPAAPAIDIHAHYFPEPYIDLIARHGARCGTTVSTDPKGNRFIQVGLHLKTGPITPAFYEPRRAAEGDAMKNPVQNWKKKYFGSFLNPHQVLSSPPKIGKT